jgi:TetR/AcrR family transcriptional regulator
MKHPPRPDDATSGESPRRKRMKGEHRRRQLIDVAIELFARKGFGGTTTREIAKAADVNEAIIFRHFETKEGLYAAILDQRARETLSEEAFEALRGLATLGDDEGFFQFFVQRILHAFRDHPQYQRLLLFSSLEKHPFASGYHNRFVAPAFGFVRDYIETRQRQGAFRECDPGMAVFTLAAAAVQYGTNRWLFERSDPYASEEEVVREVTSLFLNGIRAADGASRQQAPPSSFDT